MPPPPSFVVDSGAFTFRFGDGGAAYPKIIQRNNTNYNDFWENIPPSVPTGSDFVFAESTLETDLVSSRRKIGEIAFEKRDAAGTFFSSTAVLACFANARQSGMVVDLGYRTCNAAVVTDGWLNSVEISELGGLALDTWMLNEANIKVGNPTHITTSTNTATATTTTTNKRIKTTSSNSSSITLTLDECRTIREKGDTFILPDGTQILETISGTCLDLLFDPTPLDDPARFISLQELCLTAAAKGTNAELRHTLMSNVIVCGGLSTTKDFIPRFARELSSLARLDQPRVIAASDRDRAVGSWIGGSILASLPAFQEFKVLKQEWLENGVEAIRKKCS
jgi:actin-related protein